MAEAYLEDLGAEEGQSVDIHLITWRVLVPRRVLRVVEANSLVDLAAFSTLITAAIGFWI